MPWPPRPAAGGRAIPALTSRFDLRALDMASASLPDPSIFWLAIANHLSQDVAAAPFLWILPLGIYLLSFILCFDREGWYRPRLFRWLLPLAWIAVTLAVAQQGYLNKRESIFLFSLALLIMCIFCHGELARLRPEPG